MKLQLIMFYRCNIIHFFTFVFFYSLSSSASSLASLFWTCASQNYKINRCFDLPFVFFFIVAGILRVFNVNFNEDVLLEDER